MEQYIAVSKEQLSRFQHNGLWGLYLQDANPADLNDEGLDKAVQILKENAGELSNVILQMETLWKAWWIIRAIYWILNLNQYRKNYYALQCYIALELYEQDIKMNQDIESGSMRVVSGFALVAVTALSTLILAERFAPETMKSLKEQMLSFGEQIKPWMIASMRQHAESATETDGLLRAGNPSSYSSTLAVSTKKPVVAFQEELDLTHQFDVTQAMLPAMNTLGLLSFRAGDTCSFQLVKKAYQTSLRASHPDRGGTSEAFIAVQSAFNTLVNLMKQANAEEDSLAFMSAFDDEELAQAVRNYCDNVKKYCDAVTELCREAKKIDERVTRLADGVTRLDERVTRLDDGVTRLVEQTTQLSVEMKQMYEEAEESRVTRGHSLITEEEMAAFINDNDYFDQKDEAQEMAGWDYDVPSLSLLHGNNRYGLYHHHANIQPHQASVEIESLTQSKKA